MAVDLVVNRSFAAGTPAGSASTKSLNTESFWNYAKISIYMCPCKAGYKWDTGRLRCLSEILCDRDLQQIYHHIDY